MRALRSPAISDRASIDSVLRKLSLNPRTPTSAATPMATDNTTNPNLPGADFKSRQPMAAARFQLSARFRVRVGTGSAMAHLFGHRRRRLVRQRVFHHPAVLQHDFAIRPARHFGVMG